jgi:hypothetical protein
MSTEGLANNSDLRDERDSRVEKRTKEAPAHISTRACLGLGINLGATMFHSDVRPARAQTVSGWPSLDSTAALDLGLNIESA